MKRTSDKMRSQDKCFKISYFVQLYLRICTPVQCNPEERVPTYTPTQSDHDLPLEHNLDTHSSSVGNGPCCTSIIWLSPIWKNMKIGFYYCWLEAWIVREGSILCGCYSKLYTLVDNLLIRQRFYRWKLLIIFDRSPSNMQLSIHRP